MPRSQNRLLQLVIAGLLLNSPADVRATIYDDEPVAVTGNWGSDTYFGGASTSYGYYGSGTTTEEYNYGEPEGSGGGGSYSWNSTVDVENKALCDAISSLVSASCDLKSPPVLTVNGCGGGTSSYLVPDYLMVNATLVLGFGPIFTEACNKHDVCYGTYLRDKDACDARLELDMIESARISLTDLQWFFYGNSVKAQAELYRTALQTPPILSVSEGLYAAAQTSGACRAYSKQAAELGCSN